MARSTGRGEARARRREEGEERRGRRYPPPAEVAYEILAGADHPLSLAEIAAQGAERFLMPDAFVRDTGALGNALGEDNRRRESAGRKPLFALDGDRVSLAAQPEPGERATAPLAVPRPAASAADLRRSALLALRRRVRECDPATVEHVVARLLEAMGLRELKVAKRGRDHVVYTGRRRMGLLEIRHCIRILRGGGDPGRREVVDVRRDVGNYGAQVGVVVSAGEAGREARGEATAAGQLPVLLLCGDALAEALTEVSVGCRAVLVPEVDEDFFKKATEAAQLEEAARRARREERERREGREGREPREQRPRPEREGGARRADEGRVEATGAAAAASAEAPGADAQQSEAADALLQPATGEERPREPAAPLVADAAPGHVGEPAGVDADEEEGDEEEGPEDEGAVPPGPAAEASAGLEGERPRDGRRRRRRRRRGGRGRGREGEAPRATDRQGASGAAAVPPGEPPGPGSPGPAPAQEGAPAIASDGGRPGEPPAEGGS
jgi:hypothetical protein